MPYKVSLGTKSPPGTYSTPSSIISLQNSGPESQPFQLINDALQNIGTESQQTLKSLSYMMQSLGTNVEKHQHESDPPTKYEKLANENLAPPKERPSDNKPNSYSVLVNNKNSQDKR